MIARLAIVEEEADESAFWLEIAVDSRLIKPGLVTDLLDEFNQITAMVVASQKTLRRNRQK
jgi:four helix bundle protein